MYEDFTTFLALNICKVQNIFLNIQFPSGIENAKSTEGNLYSFCHNAASVGAVSVNDNWTYTSRNPHT